MSVHSMADFKDEHELDLTVSCENEKSARELPEKKW